MKIGNRYVHSAQRLKANCAPIAFHAHGSDSSFVTQPLVSRRTDRWITADGSTKINSHSSSSDGNLEAIWTLLYIVSGRSIDHPGLDSQQRVLHRAPPPAGQVVRCLDWVWLNYSLRLRQTNDGWTSVSGTVDYSSQFVQIFLAIPEYRWCFTWAELDFQIMLGD